MNEHFWNTDIKFLQGIGPKRAEILKNEVNILTFEDLLYYFPYKYIDKTKFHKISEVHSEMPYIQIRGEILRFRTEGEGKKERLIATFGDETGIIELVWFKGIKIIKQLYKINEIYIIFGKPNEFNGNINIPHPEVEEISKNQENKENLSLQPAYNTTEKMKNFSITSKTIAKWQLFLRQYIEKNIFETLPEYLIQNLKLISLKEALLNIHFPANFEMLQKSEYRLKFEELFYIQLKILRQKTHRSKQIRGFVFSKIGEIFNTFFHTHLPFELTEAQKKVLKEIRKDVGSGKQMNRLLQGDVGSGKTLVALMSCLMALDNGFQAAIMAPTEILALQHFATIQKFLGEMPVKIGLLTGSTTKKERRIIFEELESGNLNILVGTHALIEESVAFKNLGIVVIDEQHRLGVAQRAALWKKNEGTPPHIIVMTATPIPRTLAMTLYGDLDISVIDQLPPGRKPIKTVHYFDIHRLRAFEFIRKQIEAGNQAYVVYPLIKESEKLDYKNLEEGYENVLKAFPPPKYSISIVHGQMKAAGKDIEMQKFISGKSQILVATTVIEVGVDVPNANVMLIESAERFGLSQLHQLRGRVGRGAEQSFCILMTSVKLGSDTRKRMEMMVQSSNGFEISEMDLKLRGPGDLEGTQQSGMPMQFKLANLAKDGQILQQALDIASQVLDSDPDFSKNSENFLLKKQLEKLFSHKTEWGKIG